MLSENDVQLSLKLVPLEIKEVPVQAEDAWLANADQATMPQSADLHDMLNHLETSNEKHRHLVNELEICVHNEGFQLMTEAGVVILEEGDVIQCQASCFTVQLVKHFQRVNHDMQALTPAPMANDMWAFHDSDHSAQAQSMSVQSNSFVKNLHELTQENQFAATDPLDFLYDEKTSAQGLQSSSLSSFANAAANPGDDGLAIDLTANESMSMNDQGNILRDLGIDENRERWFQGAPLSDNMREPSPLDVLEECHIDDRRHVSPVMQNIDKYYYADGANALLPEDKSETSLFLKIKNKFAVSDVY
jgi:hypothetical protein